MQYEVCILKSRELICPKQNTCILRVNNCSLSDPLQQISLSQLNLTLSLAICYAVLVHSHVILKSNTLQNRSEASWCESRQYSDMNLECTDRIKWDQMNLKQKTLLRKNYKKKLLRFCFCTQKEFKIIFGVVFYTLY